MERGQSPTPPFVIEARENFLETCRTGIYKKRDDELASLQVATERAITQRRQQNEAEIQRVLQEAEAQARQLRQIFEAGYLQLRQQADDEADVVRSAAEDDVESLMLNFSKEAAAALVKRREYRPNHDAGLEETELPASSNDVDMDDLLAFEPAITGANIRNNSNSIATCSTGISTSSHTIADLPARSRNNRGRNRSRSPLIPLASASNLRAHRHRSSPIKGLKQQSASYPDEPLKYKHKKWLHSLLRILKTHPDAENFLAPVDWVKDKITDYPAIVPPKQRMDLGTMENKLNNNRYRSLQAFAEDIDLIVTATRIYNGDKHRVTLAAISLLVAFQRGMKSCPK